jgi:C4-dicarboxylate transporter, DcuC family
VVPAGIGGVIAAAATFTLLNGRGRSKTTEPARRDALASPTLEPPEPAAETDAPLRLNLAKALVPLVPIVLLLLAYGGWRPMAWLLPPPGAELPNALPVVRAMLIGTLLAALLCWWEIQAVTRQLFEGMGAAYASIISLTITARCFGAGIAAVGLGDALLRLTAGSDLLARFLAAGFPWALALLSGSGSGPVLAYGETFLVRAATSPGAATLAAVACLAGAFGRTMSPVAAVVIYSSGLVNQSPLALVRRLAPALLLGAVVALAIALRPT